MTALASLQHLGAPLIEPDRDPWREYRDIIADHIVNQPRSLQARIGPSEIGTPCDACLIHKLAGTPEREAGVPWLPFIGTSVHAQFEEIFAAANAGRDRVRFLVEATVNVGQVGGVDITGHADLFDLDTGDVTDWKIVGATTLRSAKAGPSTTYRVQAHLYGRGFTRRGLAVRRVRIAYLPRNSVNLDNAVIWSEPYDEQVAVEALDRADRLARAIQAYGLDATLAVLAPGGHTGKEHSCSKFDRSIPKPGHRAPETFADLLGG